MKAGFFSPITKLSDKLSSNFVEPKPQYHHSQLQNEIISVNFYPNLSKQSARYCNRILMRHKKIEILCPWVTLLVSLVSHFGNLFWACALDVKAAKVFSPAESWVVKSIPSTPAVSKAKTVRTRGRFFGRFFFPFFHFIAIEDVNLIISSHWFAETVVSYLQLPRHWWYHEKNQNKILATGNSWLLPVSFQLEVRIKRIGHI